MPVTITAVLGGLQTATGVLGKIKAAKMAKSNKRPELKDNPYLNDVYNMTGAYANTGLSASAKQSLISNNDRSLSSSIDAILTTGGSANQIGSLYESSTGALRQMALSEDQARYRNRQDFAEASLKKADEVRDKFLVNEYGPWKDQAQLIKELSSQSMQDIWGGLNTVGSAAISGMGSKMYKNLPGGGNNNMVPDGGSFSKIKSPTPMMRTPRPVNGDSPANDTTLAGLLKKLTLPGNDDTGNDQAQINSMEDLWNYYDNLKTGN